MVIADMAIAQSINPNDKYVPSMLYLLLDDQEESKIVLDELKAFPTASGAGSYVTGGRGGKTCFVDTLVDSANGRYLVSSDTYSGSLRYCLEENPSLAKTVVFLVGGEFKITQGDIYVNQKRGGNITIAGQTARDLGGVHITQGTYKLFFDNIYNVNLRYVDFKLGLAFTDSAVSIGTEEVIIDGQSYPIEINRNDFRAFEVGPWTYVIDGDTGNIVREDDGFKITRTYDVIIDHVTTGFHADESFSIGSYHTNGEDFKNITVQRSLMLPGIRGHNVGSIFGSYTRPEAEILAKNMDVHHNLWVNSTHRQPNIGGGSDAKVRVFNNVVYGWQSRTNNLAGGARVDLFNNYYKKSPSTGASSQRLDRMFRFDFTLDWVEGPVIPDIYLAGNFIEGVIEDLNADNWPAIRHHRTTAYGEANSQLSTEYQRLAPLTETENVIQFSDAHEAYDSVMNDVGEGVRFNASGETYFDDPVGLKYLTYVINRTGPNVLPSSEDWSFPSYSSSSVSRDLFDSDGVPIGWVPPENIDNQAGYSNQELYFAYMAGDFYRLQPR